MERPRRIVHSMRISVSCLEVGLPEEDFVGKTLFYHVYEEVHRMFNK